MAPDKALDVADVFRRFGPDYLDRFGASMLPSHRRAIKDIGHEEAPVARKADSSLVSSRSSHTAVAIPRRRTSPEADAFSPTRFSRRLRDGKSHIRYLWTEPARWCFESLLQSILDYDNVRVDVMRYIYMRYNDLMRNWQDVEKTFDFSEPMWYASGY